MKTNADNTRKNCYDFANFQLVIEMNNDSTNKTKYIDRFINYFILTTPLKIDYD